MTVPAGRFKDRITFQRRATASGLYQADGQSWSDVATDVAAWIKPLSGKEELIAERLQGVHAAVITVRDEAALASISTAWRILDTRTSDVFDIKHIAKNDFHDRFLTITCEAGAGDDAG